ncbi:MAG: hypothetical protein AAFO61_15040 [Pseudomonadota bacterium]
MTENAEKEISLKLDKLQAEVEKLRAETRATHANERKMLTETFWYPVIAVTGIFAAAYAVIKYVVS